MYSLSTYILQHTDLPQALSLLAEFPFPGIELSGTGSALLCAWEENPRGVVARLHERGIAVPSIHCTKLGRQYLGDPDSSARQASIGENLACMERMRESGIDELVIHPLGDGSSWDDERLTRARDSLETLAAHAAACGLKLAVENAQKPGTPSARVEFLLEFIRDLGDHVGICLDVGHAHLADLDPLQQTQVALGSKRLFSLHLHDIDAHGMDHLLPDPAEGCIDLPAIVRMLDSAHFQGLRTLELRPLPEVVTPRLKRAVACRDGWEHLGAG